MDWVLVFSKMLEICSVVYFEPYSQKILWAKNPGPSKLLFLRTTPLESFQLLHASWQVLENPSIRNHMWKICKNPRLQIHEKRSFPRVQLLTRARGIPRGFWGCKGLAKRRSTKSIGFFVLLRNLVDILGKEGYLNLLWTSSLIAVDGAYTLPCFGVEDRNDVNCVCILFMYNMCFCIK